jgi:hypothetical protein
VRTVSEPEGADDVVVGAGDRLGNAAGRGGEVAGPPLHAVATRASATARHLNA